MLSKIATLNLAIGCEPDPLEVGALHHQHPVMPGDVLFVEIDQTLLEVGLKDGHRLMRAAVAELGPESLECARRPAHETVLQLGLEMPGPLREMSRTAPTRKRARSRS